MADRALEYERAASRGRASAWRDGNELQDVDDRTGNGGDNDWCGQRIAVDAGIAGALVRASEPRHSNSRRARCRQPRDRSDRGWRGFPALEHDAARREWRREADRRRISQPATGRVPGDRIVDRSRRKATRHGADARQRHRVRGLAVNDAMPQLTLNTATMTIAANDDAVVTPHSLP